jgi:terminase, large subunit
MERLSTPVGWVNDWKYIAQKFCEAVKALREGSPEKYKTWLNSFMSESYEEKGDQPEWSVLKARCEPYQPLTVPEKAESLTAGVDVHPDRLPVSIYAWGPGEECWLVYHVEIFGDVLQPDVWNQLDQLLFRNYSHTSGAEYQIVSAGIDAGDGNTTQAVRNYCRTRSPRVFALKGASTANKPIIGVPTKQDVTWQGQKIPNGVELWPIGTDTAKADAIRKVEKRRTGTGIHAFLHRA